MAVSLHYGSSYVVNDAVGDPLGYHEGQGYDREYDLEGFCSLLFRGRRCLARHCEAGRERKVRIRQITNRLIKEPITAMAIMGMRMASA